uniref:Uncharacterized protein n=1 Tax=Zea mays TaxID=4577 RepID=A0A804UMK4_MAIZE
MIYAYFHPNVERWMEKLEESETKVGFLWYEHIYKLDKEAPCRSAQASYVSDSPATIWCCFWLS